MTVALSIRERRLLCRNSEVAECVGVSERTPATRDLARDLRVVAHIQPFTENGEVLIELASKASEHNDVG